MLKEAASSQKPGTRSHSCRTTEIRHFTCRVRDAERLCCLQNFVALIPLALVLGEVTEDLATRFGDVIGGLLNATFGNVVELILSVAALTKGLYTVVAMSLIGSILSNLLLVMGEPLCYRRGFCISMTWLHLRFPCQYIWISMPWVEPSEAC